jgi:anaerobic magnesium-protoporphyrin IX monomethyl ester cyclase
MPDIFLFNPPDERRKRYTREGRCTQSSGFWATLWPPLSLATAAALLLADGHRVILMDYPALRKSAAELTKQWLYQPPDVAVWSTGTPTLGADLAIASQIKKNLPQTLTGVVGTHVSSEPAAVLESSAVDVVIRSEPEQTIQDLCRHIHGCWTAVPGISYRDRRTGRIQHNPDRRFMSPEQIPAPAWHLIDNRPYRMPLNGRKFLMVAPARGCPFSCSFCTAPVYYGRRIRWRPVASVVEEIESNRRRLGIRDYLIWADTFTADRNYVRKFCDHICARRLDIAWTCNSRVDTVDRDLLETMRSAGLWMISFGLESASRDVLEQAGKAITVDQSRAAVQAAHAAGIRTSGHFIFGLPGETENSMRATLKLALELPLDFAQFYAAAPFPGTALYRQALQNKWLRPDTPIAQEGASMSLPSLPAEAVDAFIRCAYRRFYLRPAVIRNLLAMSDVAALFRMAWNLRNVFTWLKP